MLDTVLFRTLIVTTKQEAEADSYRRLNEHLRAIMLDTALFRTLIFFEIDFVRFKKLRIQFCSARVVDWGAFSSL